MIDDGRPIFLQIAEAVADSIVSGALTEGERAPSTNELVAFYRVNPATAAKGITVLVDDGVLVKQRGIGMFVADGARARLVAERRGRLAERFVDPLLVQAAALGLSRQDVLDLIAAREMHPTPRRQEP